MAVGHNITLTEASMFSLDEIVPITTRSVVLELRCHCRCWLQLIGITRTDEVTRAEEGEAVIRKCGTLNTVGQQAVECLSIDGAPELAISLVVLIIWT